MRPATTTATMTVAAATVLAATLLAGASTATTLPEAIAAGQDSLAATLLRGGADLEARHPDRHGASALMLAAARDDADLVNALIDLGADVDARDDRGDTPLNWAARHGAMNAARELMQAGANPRLSGRGNALQTALRRGHEELVQVLSVAMEARHTPGGRDLMLMVAAYRDDAAAVATGLDRGADPDARDDVGRPLLHPAARLGHVAALGALVNGGADPDAQDENGFTALMVAAREAQAEAVLELLVAGADPNHVAAATGNRLTPLHLAAMGGDPAIVRTLAGHGARLDATDRDGRTPALLALDEGHVDCAVALVELGADPTIAADGGASVLSIARARDIAPLLAAIDAAD